MIRLSNHRRSIGLVAVGLSAALALGACGSSGKETSGSGGSQTASGASSTKGTISIGTEFAPSSLDPALGTTAADYPYLYMVFDRLIQFNPRTGALEPMLATSWHFADKDLQLVVQLRHGVNFQDGTPFNSTAVVDASKAFLSAGDALGDLQNVTSVTATDAYEVVYHLSAVNSQLPYGLADRAGMIPSPTAVAKEGKSFATHPVGAGPYEFVSEVAGSSYRFSRFNGYWNDTAQPRVANITFQIFGNDTTLVSAVRSGTINIADGVQPQDVTALKSYSNLYSAIEPGTSQDLAYFNSKVKPFDNPKVRLAFNLALNRKAIMDAGTDGLGQVRTEPVPTGAAGYSASQNPVWTYNPSKAKQLMAQAGYPHGVTMTCYEYAGLGYQTTGPIIISEEKKIGINIHVQSGTTTLVAPFFTKNAAPCFLAAFSDGANPTTPYEALLNSTSYYNAGHVNYGADQLVDKFFSAPTSEYPQLYSQINHLMKTNPAYSVFYSAPEVIVYQKNISGWTNSPYGLYNWQSLIYKG